MQKTNLDICQAIEPNVTEVHVTPVEGSTVEQIQSSIGTALKAYKDGHGEDFVDSDENYSDELDSLVLQTEE